MQKVGPMCSECKHRRLGCSKSIPMEDREALGPARRVLGATQYYYEGLRTAFIAIRERESTDFSRDTVVDAELAMFGSMIACNLAPYSLNDA